MVTRDTIIELALGFAFSSVASCPPASAGTCAAPLFAPHVEFGVGEGPGWAAIGDLDADRDADLAVTNTVDDTVSILLNHGDGSFAPSVDYVTGNAGDFPSEVAMADLDEDGDLDLTIANPAGFQGPVGSVAVLLNSGDGAFGAPILLDAGDDPGSIAVADLDGDRDLDLAAAQLHGGSVSILINQGEGVFAPYVSYRAGYTLYSIAASDLDGDQDQDLAFANCCGNGVSLLLNNGDGTFPAAVHWFPQEMSISIAIDDFDGDADADLAMPDFGDPGGALIFPNDGDAVFGAAVSYDAGPMPLHVASGDLDGDGDPDLAVTNGGGLGDPGTVSILLNSGNGTFAAPTAYGVNIVPNSSAIGDLNGDDYPDVVVVNWGQGSGDTVSILLNICGETPVPGDVTNDGQVNIDDLFAIIAAWGTCPSPPAPCPEDLDDDGEVDIDDLFAVLANWS